MSDPEQNVAYRKLKQRIYVAMLNAFGGSTLCFAIANRHGECAGLNYGDSGVVILNNKKVVFSTTSNFSPDRPDCPSQFLFSVSQDGTSIQLNIPSSNPQAYTWATRIPRNEPIKDLRLIMGTDGLFDNVFTELPAAATQARGSAFSVQRQLPAPAAVSYQRPSESAAAPIKRERTFPVQRQQPALAAVRHQGASVSAAAPKEGHRALPAQVQQPTSALASHQSTPVSATARALMGSTRSPSLSTQDERSIKAANFINGIYNSTQIHTPSEISASVIQFLTDLSISGREMATLIQTPFKIELPHTSTSPTTTIVIAPSLGDDGVRALCSLWSTK